MSSADWSWLMPWAITIVVVLVLVLVLAFIRWLLTHTVRERMTRSLAPYYLADRDQDGRMPSEAERGRLTSQCIRVWPTSHGYATHVTRRLVKGLDDKVLLDAAAAACPDGWRHHVRRLFGFCWIVSDGRMD